jgi:hypothetical protein
VLLLPQGGSRYFSLSDGSAVRDVPGGKRRRSSSVGLYAAPQVRQGLRLSRRRTERAHMTETKFEPSYVNVRIKISALWTSMLFVFAYVDLFSLYRRDFRADLGAGEIGGFTVNQLFLLGTSVYVVIPSVMVFCALILRPRVDRIANIESPSTSLSAHGLCRLRIPSSRHSEKLWRTASSTHRGISCGAA